jgi:nitrite reductase (NADH) small subunit
MSWIDVIELDALVPGRGVRALVGTSPVAIFLLGGGTLHAIDDIDPGTGASVLSRGLTGSLTVDGDRVPTVASPLHKERFDLRSGRCLDRDAAVATWPVRARGGRVEVGASPLGR